MIRRLTEAKVERRDNIRGGAGAAHLREYIAPGEMCGVEFASILTLEPGASVGEHRHDGTEELYLVLGGSGTATLDGEAFQVGPGDAFLVKDGHSHGLASGAGGQLEFLAVLTKVAP